MREAHDRRIWDSSHTRGTGVLALLRQFGSDRLIFATDYPDNRVLSPSEIYDSYFHILNRMDFTPEEVQKIAYDNIHKIVENSKKQG